MPERHELACSDGRLLVAHSSEGGSAGTLIWHHGSPQTGALLDPVLRAATERDWRLVSYGRPSYGGSSPLPGRTVASAAADVATVADALGISTFVTMGASGGGPHALACAALLPGSVLGVVTLAGVAPFTTSFDWYAGMAAPGGLAAASRGRSARAEFALTDEFDESQFGPRDWAALSGDWRSLGADSGASDAFGPDGLIDDDVAFTAPWGFDPSDVTVPVLLVHGGADRVVPSSHSTWLLDQLSDAELWLQPREGHVSVLHSVPLAMDWLRTRA